MKKKAQPTQKEKQFSASPFKALKGVELQQRSPEVQAPAPTAKPKPQHKEAQRVERPAEDVSLFLDAMAGVRPLRETATPQKAAGAPRPVKSAVDEEEQRIFMQAVEALKIDVRFTEELPREEDALRPPPVNRLRQLRRGGIRIDLQLDLHGLTREEALEHLAPFVRRAYERGQKGVLVITGKGNNSNGEPVLKQAVSAWLREHGKGIVAEFAPAPNEMGGSGAFVVFLKEKKVEAEGEK